MCTRRLTTADVASSSSADKDPVGCATQGVLALCLQSILDDATAQFTRHVELDQQANLFVNLLYTVQQIVLFTMRLGQHMLQSYVDVRFKQAKSEHRKCPRCDEPMEWLKNSEWLHGTVFGELRVKDAYAYCRKCNLSARPVHGWLGTGMLRWSLDVQEKLVDLASDESCQHAVDKLKRLQPGVDIHRSTALRLLHQHGHRARDFVADKLASALAQATQEPDRLGAVELEVEYDAGMIPVATLESIPTPEGKKPELTPVRKLPKRHKNCRWEEAKLGLVQVPGDKQDRLYSVRPTAELDEAFKDLFALACMKGWSEQTQVRGLADGARHIRPRMEATFKASPFRFILDRPHAKEHLGTAAQQLENLGALGAGSKQAWSATALQRLESGAALEVVQDFRLAATTADDDTKTVKDAKDCLRLEADYFERNQDAVAYQYYREQGWSTASSEVESGHRSVVQPRLKLPGTWWHPDNVKNILALRMVKLNGWWDEYWNYQRHLCHQRALELRSLLPRTKLPNPAT